MLIDHFIVRDSDIERYKGKQNISRYSHHTELAVYKMNLQENINDHKRTDASQSGLVSDDCPTDSETEGQKEQRGHEHVSPSSSSQRYSLLLL